MNERFFRLVSLKPPLTTSMRAPRVTGLKLIREQYEGRDCDIYIVSSLPRYTIGTHDLAEDVADMCLKIRTSRESPRKNDALQEVAELWNVATRKETSNIDRLY